MSRSGSDPRASACLGREFGWLESQSAVKGVNMRSLSRRDYLWSEEVISRSTAVAPLLRRTHVQQGFLSAVEIHNHVISRMTLEYTPDTALLITGPSFPKPARQPIHRESI